MYFLKKALIPWVYTLSMTLISYGLTALNDSLFWLAVVLSVVNIVMYAVVVVVVSVKDGETAMKTLHENDLARQRIIETGDDIKINKTVEYKAYKGFLVGLVVVSPMLLLLLIHAIVYFTTGTTVFGGIAAILFRGYSSFFTMFGMTLVGANCFYVLVFVPLIMSINGVPYIIGAKRQRALYKMLHIKHAELHGEEN